MVCKTNANYFYDRFLSGDVIGRYLYGINEFSAAVADIVDIDGFIDDYTEAGFFMGKPILS